MNHITSNLGRPSRTAAELFRAAKPARKSLPPVALVKRVGTRPMTTSRIVALHYGKRHDNVLRAIETFRTQVGEVKFNALKFEAVEYIDAKGETQPEWLMSQVGFAAVAVRFTGTKASNLAADIMLAFATMTQRLCTEERAAPNWLPARMEAAHEFAHVAEVLADVRESRGKKTEPHHFVNEAKLLRFAISGSTDPLYRKGMSAGELKLLAAVERHDARLIAKGFMDYRGRKTDCRDFVLQARARCLASAPAAARIGDAS